VGLKTDIKNAFIKNITPEKDNDFEMSAEGKKKIDDLSEDLSKAIVDFITAQTFRVDKLSASAGPITPQRVPPITVPNAPGVPGAPHTIPPSTILEVNVNVDKDGGSPSPVGGGVLHSNKSEVRLRKGEVTEE